MATAPAKSPVTKNKSIDEKRKFLEDQIKSLEKVTAITDLLKQFPADVQREALRSASDALGCAKPRKPRTRKEKPVEVHANGGQVQPAPAA